MHDNKNETQNDGEDGVLVEKVELDDNMRISNQIKNQENEKNINS